MDSQETRLMATQGEGYDESVPTRSGLWFENKDRFFSSGRILDLITVVLTITLAAFAFIVFWPIISKIDFEEAFFTPLVPFLVAILERFGVTANDAIRVLFITSLMVSTAGVYLLVWDLTKIQITPILAAVAYLIPPVPIFVLTFLRRGLLEVELASAKSFFTIVYGDGAHFLGLALIPFAAIFFLRYLKRAQKIDLALTVFVCALILLANRSWSINLVLILAVLALSELFLGLARLKFARFMRVLIFTIGTVSFWYTLSFFFETLDIFNKEVIGNLKFLFPLPFIVSLLTLLFSFVFYGRREERQPIFAAFLLFSVFLIITVNWLFTGYSFLPHPQRLFPSLMMFGSVVLALSISAVVDKLHLAAKLSIEKWSVPARTLAAMVFGFCSFLILALVAFSFSPLAILLVSGPRGIWFKIREGVLADRRQVLEVAGGNFKLVKTEVADWQLLVGTGATLVFLAILTFWLVKEFSRYE